MDLHINAYAHVESCLCCLSQIQDNSRYVSMVEHVLGMDAYYFSSTYDVTHTLQRLDNTSPDFVHMPLHERVRMILPLEVNNL